MIRINLLPAGLEAAPSRVNPAIPISVPVILLAMLLVPFHIKKMADRKKLQSEVSSIKNELETYAPIIKQVEALEGAKAQLTQKKSIIQQLESERLRYPQFFDDFVKLIPNNVWMTNVITTHQGNTNTLMVNMDVAALDSYAIADLVSNLEASQLFSEVDLGAIAISQSQTGTQTMTFRITTNYKKAEQPTDAAKKS